MRTHLDCLPCLLRLAVSGARRSCPGDQAVQARIVAAWADRLSGLDMDRCPPDHAADLYALLRRETGVDDPFADSKRRANERVLSLLPGLERMLLSAGDPLSMALELSIIGNCLDEGVSLDLDWEAEIAQGAKTLDADSVRAFDRAARPGADVLILGDNAGEIAMDTLLAGLLVARGCRVTYAVRGRPVLNDATESDARFVGMDRVCRVISSGSDAPATIPARVAPGFLERMDRADLVLSKGQGNFEALHPEFDRLFFAFKVKCGVVAAHTGIGQGVSLLLPPSTRLPSARREVA